VARAIASSRTPVLVGVGHEVDVSLADFAADQRAATPTDAARLIAPARSEVQQQVGHLGHQLKQAMQATVAMRSQAVARQMVVLEHFVQLPRSRVVALEGRLLHAQRQTLQLQHQKLTGLQRLVASFDPTATLKRGYAIVRHNNNQVVTAPNQVPGGSSLMIQLAAGTLKTTVDDD
jgi:exodeoxyribonuclease VII large subunit